MLKNIIRFSLEVFYRLFKFDLNWDFAEIDINTPEELKESISMTYSHEDNIILVNPLLLEQYYDENYTEDQIYHIVFSLIAHEYRHAWQHRSSNYQNDFQQYNSFIQFEIDYVHQKVEIDAYAFQEACYWIISGTKNQHLIVPEEAADAVHQLAYVLYYQYHDDIKLIIYNLIEEYLNVSNQI